MVHSEKFVAATYETLSLYVDLVERKVAEFENEKQKIMKDYIEKIDQIFIPII